MSNRSEIVSALTTEFGADVSFSAGPPSVFTAPSVVVTPADPFLEVATHGLIRETWEVLVVVSMKDPAKGIDQMRQISLRVMGAVQPLGAVWKSASAPYVVAGDKGFVASKNRVEFKYPPADELPEEEEQ